jgi:hypothetical protein
MNDGTLVSKKLGTRRLIFVDSIHTAGDFAPPSARRTEQSRSAD